MLPDGAARRRRDTTLAALPAPAAFARHREVVDAVFDGRGRTVAQRLGRLAGRPRAARAALAAAGLDPAATPARLPPEAWAAVTRALADRRRAGGGHPRR